MSEGERGDVIRRNQRERVDREIRGERERESEEGRHLEGSGHTCHIPFI